MSTQPTQSPAPHRAPPPSNVPPDRIYDVDMYDIEGLADGFHEAWKRIQKDDTPDLIWTPFAGGHWIATRAKIIREVYSDPTRFSSEIIIVPKEAGEKFTMIPTRMDPPIHTPYRKVLDSALGMSKIKKFDAVVRGTAVELIDKILSGHSTSCEFTSAYSKIFPVKVFMGLADLPMSDVPALAILADKVARPAGNTPDEQARCLEEGNQGLFDYLDPYIRERAGGAGDDMITIMANSKINGDRISHDEALRLTMQLLMAGLDTVVNVLSFMMLHLARHPDKVAEMRAADEITLKRATEEMFRRFPVVSDARMVAKDMHYCGVDLKRGDMILCPTVLDGLDERVNPNPMELSLHRGSLSHSTFAVGPHRCAGLHLARLEVTVTLEEWLKRIPVFSLKPGCQPTYQSGIVAAVENIQLVWPSSH